MVWHIIRADILLIAGIFRLTPAGLGKILRNLQNICTYYMLNHLIRCMYLSFIEEKKKLYLRIQEPGFNNAVLPIMAEKGFEILVFSRKLNIMQGS